MTVRTLVEDILAYMNADAKVYLGEPSSAKPATTVRDQNGKVFILSEEDDNE